MAPTGRKVHFETVDAMRVHNGKITERCGFANFVSLPQQLDAWPAATRGPGSGRSPAALAGCSATNWRCAPDAGIRAHLGGSRSVGGIAPRPARRYLLHSDRC